MRRVEIQAIICAFLLTCCGVRENRDFHSLEDWPIVGQAILVPYPLHGCKEVYRRLAKGEVEDAVGRLIALATFDPATLSGPTYTECITRVSNSLGPVSDRALLEAMCRVEVVSQFDRNLVEGIERANRFMEERLPSPALAMLDFSDEIKRSDPDLFACSRSIHDYLEMESPQSTKDFHDAYGRYYSPRRKQVVASIAVIDRNMELDDGSPTFSNIFRHAQTNQHAKSQAYLSHLHERYVSTSGQSLSTATEQRVIAVTSYTKRNGLPGHWVDPDSFEIEWQNTFADVQKRLEACDIVFEGSVKKYQSPDLPAARCTETSTPARTPTVRALATALIVLDMAGVAHSENDDEAARELLEISKEILKLSADLAVGLSPLGKAKDIVEAISGHSISPDFDKLSNVERVVSVLGAVTVGSPMLKVMVKYSGKSRIIKKIVSHEAENLTKTILGGADETFEFAVRRLPANGGRWAGERGKSIWISENAEILAATNGEGIPFRRYFPDFSKWAKDTFHVEGLNGTSSDFAKAYELVMAKYGLPSKAAAEEWLMANKLTIHHVEDGVTLQLIPTSIHKNTPHVGGAALLRKIIGGGTLE